MAVGQRVLEIWPYVQMYIATVKACKCPFPKTKSFATVSESCEDPIFLVKVNIFTTVAKDITWLLTKYKTDMPMLPYLSADLHEVIYDLATRIGKLGVMANIKGPVKLFALSPDDRSQHVNTAAVNIVVTT